MVERRVSQQENNLHKTHSLGEFCLLNATYSLMIPNFISATQVPPLTCSPVCPTPSTPNVRSSHPLSFGTLMPQGLYTCPFLHFSLQDSFSPHLLNMLIQTSVLLEVSLAPFKNDTSYTNTNIPVHLHDMHYYPIHYLFYLLS